MLLTSGSEYVLDVELPAFAEASSEADEPELVLDFAVLYIVVTISEDVTPVLIVDFDDLELLELELFDDFVEVLKQPDVCFLAEIYAAREKNTIGISSRDIAERIPGARYFPDFATLEEALRLELREGDIFLTVGAGDIYKVGEALLK